MGTSDKAKRIAAKCVQCGKIYTSQLWTDGTITPIGIPTGCRCGGTDFINRTEESADDDSSTEELVTDL